MMDYGYETAVPDSEKYGYGPAQPDSQAKYGYGDAQPDDRVNDRNRTRDRRAQMQRGESQRIGRRSSMKHEGAPRRSSISYRGEIVVNLPGQSKPVRRRTSICFDEQAEVKEVQPVHELTDKPEQLWFQQEEYGVIREKAILLTQLAISGGDQLITDKKLCLRGLECHINKEYVDEEQDLAWRTVFLEQYQQRLEGGFDDEAVAQMYEMASMPSRARALQRAQADLKEAEKHTRGVRSVLRRHSLLA